MTQIYRVGSLAYMSPEQLDGGTLDCRADMYSLGAVLYHLIAGRPTFDGHVQSAMMHQIYHTKPAASLPAHLIEAIDAREVNWVTFTSSSTARNFATLLGPDYAAKLSRIKIASIGRTQLVESSRPPSPTSSTVMFTCSSAKIRNPIAVTVSK